jgi:hypothetical protein
MQATHSMMVASIVAVVGLAACGTGSASPTVAKLATAATTTTAPSSAPSGGAPAGNSGGNIGFAISGGGGGGAADLTKMEAYAKCMRAHGVAGFPDPTPSAGGGGQIQIRGGPGTGIDPNSTVFQGAENACKSLLPNGGVAPAMSAAQQQAFLDFAACMRSHGVPSFPDPQFSNGGVRISGGGVDPNSPAFQSAQKACGAKLPGGFAGKG